LLLRLAALQVKKLKLKIFAVYEKAYGAKAGGNLNFSYFFEG